MGYLSDEVVEQCLDAAKATPEADQAFQQFFAAWQAEGLPLPEVNLHFVGAVFSADPPRQLLEEDRRLNAINPDLFQLVYVGSDGGGLDLQSYDSLEAATATLESLEPDQIGEGGGLVMKGEEVVAEKLQLKFMEKGDFLEYYSRAREPAPSDFKSDPVQAVRDTLVERLEDLTRLAPQIGSLKREYEAKNLPEPEAIYGRPSEALVEFSKMYPNYVSLGGCSRGGRGGPRGGADTPPTPPPVRDDN
mmetsp:Transcript_27327/g.41305  ORF Transcript_27327/g.41305 Transcript_27327/m.41305 type:complete len:247 (+) Transcript_27327:62-802(+)|eukprot:CAMPEP_0194752574 /NCGR_PEP_ID=MMETSP0323_2-20130528/6403_1 /TAXON_ID=2866 ORGANISM="Crypthecodinium cohnii, Strain Seligo" /NCGR_SAMPLE_ID=MMETSP0323_2 /ASSEMBLY_ACC=CAM_ASM_000346 /LENGTH=246 /DNA_ID=CAMNT_0039669627 /DNA_START=49 /DNA_END=789 /DNA_ORIENTATION=-